MIDKTVSSIADALAGIESGATVLLGGFGSVGQPKQLIEGLLETEACDLTVVSNNAGAGGEGLVTLLEARRVAKIICSFPRVAGSTIFEDLYRAGDITLELVPQGTLAERLRAAGAGIPAFYTPTGAGTLIAEGKEMRSFGGRLHVLETALHGDVALIEGWTGDRWGNVTYRATGRNFNPVMAAAAALTVAQVQHLEPLGTLDPEQIVTPGVHVDRMVHIPYGDPYQSAVA